MLEDTHPRCPHCGLRMVRWANPEGSTWGGEYQHVCFDDQCPYFVRGWAWMMSRYNIAASYRFRLDPMTGDQGPLPVWSASDFRAGVIAETEEERAHAL